MKRGVESEHSHCVVNNDKGTREVRGLSSCRFDQLDSSDKQTASQVQKWMNKASQGQQILQISSESNPSCRRADRSRLSRGRSRPNNKISEPADVEKVSQKRNSGSLLERQDGEKSGDLNRLCSSRSRGQVGGTSGPSKQQGAVKE